MSAKRHGLEAHVLAVCRMGNHTPIRVAAVGKKLGAPSPLNTDHFCDFGQQCLPSGFPQ